MLTGPWITNPMLRGALTAADAGLRVFQAHHPIRWPSAPTGDPARDCSCGQAACAAPGAHPTDEAWRDRATSAAIRLHEHWEALPEANPAAVTGERIDVLEVPIGIADELARQLYEFVDDFPVARTGTGLWHFYIAATGQETMTLAGTGSGATPALDGDGRRNGWEGHAEGDGGRPPAAVLHGGGGWVLIPPARHIDGGAYRWQRSLIDVVPPRLTVEHIVEFLAAAEAAPPPPYQPMSPPEPPAWRRPRRGPASWRPVPALRAFCRPSAALHPRTAP